MSTPSIYEERLDPEVFAHLEARARVDLAGPEGDEVRAQIAWFQRKYPTPLARLAYIRRKVAETLPSPDRTVAGE